MEKINVNVCPSEITSNLTEAKDVSKKITLSTDHKACIYIGWCRGGIAYNMGIC